jgi:hypothetical protein
VERVKLLADKFEDRIGKRNLSAASKLLWLSKRSGFVVYDTRTVDALALKFRKDFNRRDYESYCGAWREEYANHEEAIAEAVAGSLETLPGPRHWGVATKRLVEWSRAEWFRERVFDKYLWLIGGQL